MKAKLLPRITEAMLYLLAAFVLLCAVTLYIPGSGWDQIIAAYCQTDSDPVALRVFLTAAAVFALWILFELLLVMRTVSTDPLCSATYMRSCAWALQRSLRAQCSPCGAPHTSRP